MFNFHSAKKDDFSGRGIQFGPFSRSFSFEMVMLGLLHIQTEQSDSLLCFFATDALQLNADRCVSSL